MRLIQGVWVPISDPADWLLREQIVGGLPAYQLDRIEQALLATKGRTLAIDGGAHIGLWTLRFARVFKSVLAFEPHPVNICCLNHNLIRHVADNVTVYPAALDVQDGEIKIGLCGKKSFQWRTKGYEAGTEITVPSRSIDSLNLPILDLLKLDVEGHEFPVLTGALYTIARCKSVVIIEEKLEPQFLATKLLESIGMQCTWRSKHDYLFEWPVA